MRVPDGSVLLTGADCVVLRPGIWRATLERELRRAGLEQPSRRALVLFEELQAAADAAVATRAARVMTGVSTSMTAMTAAAAVNIGGDTSRVDESGSCGTIDEWLSPAEVSAQLGLGERQVRRLRVERVLVGSKRGKSYVYEPTSVALEAERRRG